MIFNISNGFITNSSCLVVDVIVDIDKLLKRIKQVDIEKLIKEQLDDFMREIIGMSPESHFRKRLIFNIKQVFREFRNRVIQNQNKKQLLLHTSTDVQGNGIDISQAKRYAYLFLLFYVIKPIVKETEFVSYLT
jgi:hypothetical protein